MYSPTLSKSNLKSDNKSPIRIATRSSLVLGNWMVQTYFDMMNFKAEDTEATTYVKNQCKWKAADKYAKDNNYEFQIWTEHTLQKLGIMPKPLKPLKPLSPSTDRSRR